MEAAADGRRPDFVCKVYRMLQECPQLINWDNGKEPRRRPTALAVRSLRPRVALASATRAR